MKTSNLKKKCFLLLALLLFGLVTPKQTNVVNAAVVCISDCGGGGSTPIYYTSSCVNGTNDISADSDVLYAAKKDSKVTTNKSSFSRYAYIASSQNVHIYHFKPSTGGYWNIYTTGTTDTIIKVYEDNSFLWIKSFDSIGSNDDPDSTEGDYIENRKYYNASFKAKFKSGEDYYICVRAYSTKIGSYYLHVEPNEDKLNPAYNVKNNNRWDITGISTNTYYTNYREYLTKDETLFLYWAVSDIPITYLDDYGREQKFTFDDWSDLVSEGTENWLAVAYSVVGLMLGVVSAFLDPTKISTAVITGISLSVSGLSFVDTMINTRSSLEKKSLLSSLTSSNVCNIRYNMSTNRWMIDKSIIISHETYIYTMCDNYGNIYSIPYFCYSYSGFNGYQMMTGDAYNRGKWSNK